MPSRQKKLRPSKLDGNTDKTLWLLSGAVITKPGQKKNTKKTTELQKHPLSRKMLIQEQKNDQVIAQILHEVEKLYLLKDDILFITEQSGTTQNDKLIVAPTSLMRRIMEAGQDNSMTRRQDG